MELYSTVQLMKEEKGEKTLLALVLADVAAGPDAGLDCGEMNGPEPSRYKVMRQKISH